YNISITAVDKDGNGLASKPKTFQLHVDAKPEIIKPDDEDLLTVENEECSIIVQAHDDDYLIDLDGNEASDYPDEYPLKFSVKISTKVYYSETFDPAVLGYKLAENKYDLELTIAPEKAIMGVYTIEIVATDKNGTGIPSETLIFDLTINAKPEIVNPGFTMKTYANGEPYQLSITAEDPDGNYPLNIGLEVIPTNNRNIEVDSIVYTKSVTAEDQQINIYWADADAKVDTYKCILTATDTYNLSSTIEFSFKINQKPEFLIQKEETIPVQSEQTLFRKVLKASDKDEDECEIWVSEIKSKEDGFTASIGFDADYQNENFNDENGETSIEFVWIDIPNNMPGEFEITILTRDILQNDDDNNPIFYGETVEMTYMLNIGNLSPDIDNMPKDFKQIVTPGIHYEKVVIASDPEDNELTFSFYSPKSKPDSMYIKKVSTSAALIVWDPTVLGEIWGPADERNLIRIAVTDSYRTGDDVKNYILEIKEDFNGGNYLPVIIDKKDHSVKTNNPYKQIIEANDIDGNRIKFRLIDEPEGMEIKTLNDTQALISWDNPSVEGEYVICFYAEDIDKNNESLYGHDFSSFTLTVSGTGDLPPVIEKLADEEIEMGTDYSKNVTATDPDQGDSVAFFRLIDAPYGMTIDNSGKIIWDAVDKAGDHQIMVVAEDKNQGISIAKFKLTVFTPDKYRFLLVLNRKPLENPFNTEKFTKNSALAVNNRETIRTAVEEKAEEIHLFTVDLCEAMLFSKIDDNRPIITESPNTKDNILIQSLVVGGEIQSVFETLITNEPEKDIPGDLSVVSNFKIDATIKLSYDKDKDGRVNNIFPVVQEDKLQLYQFKNNEWHQLITTVDVNQLLISAPVEELNSSTIFAIGVIRAPAASLEETIIYPNPYLPRSGGKFDSPGIVFEKLPVSSRIKIYNILGDLIIEMEETDADGILIWDGKNDSGDNAASGVYFAYIEAAGGNKIFKLAIER
ncbi:MAG: T9SS type A sorting domain-containing protein, partial [bacterium]